MNGTYYQNPTFPTNQNNYDVNMNHANNPGMINNPNSANTPNPINNFNQDYNIGTSLPMEQSYIENILRLNKEKWSKLTLVFQTPQNGETKYLLVVLKKQEEII